MKINHLIKSLDANYIEHRNIDDFQVRGISCNSKDVSHKYVFVAIKGNCDDGARYIDEAIKRGAGAVVLEGHQLKTGPLTKIPIIAVKSSRLALARLASQFYGNPSSKIKLIGITGTNGKTTISYLIESILKKNNFSPAVIGTINYRFNDKIISSKNTTPDSVKLQRLFKAMLEERIDYAIMEVSSHALDQNRVEAVDFHSAIFSNLTHDHLDYHKTINNYFKAKGRLFKNLNPEAFAVINNDDKYAGKIKALTKAKIITYGIKEEADITARDIKLGAFSTEFCIVSKRANFRLKTKLIGMHNLYNILAAFSWAQKEGLDVNLIKSAIGGLSFVPGRLERVSRENDFEVFVDYAHTEDALSHVISALRSLYKKRIIVVFGCGGERDKTKRPRMGRIATELSDYAIITSDNPRSEDPDDIINDIKKGIKKNNFCVIPEREEAIKKSLSMAKSGDVVLVAGKGHENYQVFKDRTISFDDRKIIRTCLRLTNS